MEPSACLGTIYEWKERCILVAKRLIDANVDPSDTDNIGIYDHVTIQFNSFGV